MTDAEIEGIKAWLIERGLGGATESELLHGFCLRSCEAGLPLVRALAVVDTLHPVYEGRAFRWRGDGVEEPPVTEYRPTNAGENLETWRRNAFYHLYASGDVEVRRRIGFGDPTDFSYLEPMRAEGVTDFVAMANRFAADGVIGEMDCVYTHWATPHAQGFCDADLEALRRLVPTLALAVKCASMAQVARTLVEVYLGRDAGRRVLGGRIARGVADRINAVLWFSDLRSYTAISDSASPDEVIPLLNDYLGLVISAICDAGGDVLKLMGDGVLAIFNTDDPAEACQSALQARAAVERGLVDLNARRAEEGRPVSTVYLGLHIGDVFYGNVGSDERLDFTVVGPAVNEVSRIAAMCRSVDRPLIVSSAFVDALPQERRADMVSLGRFALRGVARAQELFTLDPEKA